MVDVILCNYINVELPNFFFLWKGRERESGEGGLREDSF